MLEDMQIRNLSPHTIDGYLRYVAQFAQHFGVSPDRLGPEHVRTYQLHLLEQQVHQSILVQTVCALRFLLHKGVAKAPLCNRILLSYAK
jgi:integrase/recombinase XerD